MTKTSEHKAPAEVSPPMQDGQDPPNVQMLKYVVIFLGVLLILCFITVFAVIGYRIANPRPASAVQAYSEIELPVGPQTQIGQVDIDGERMAVHLMGEANDELVVIDVKRGVLISRVKLSRTRPQTGN
jgi:hypothetical protein